MSKNSNGYDFDYYINHPEEDNRADDYYEDGEERMYCEECDNLMVPTGNEMYKCPACGSTEGSPLF